MLIKRKTTTNLKKLSPFAIISFKNFKNNKFLLNHEIAFLQYHEIYFPINHAINYKIVLSPFDKTTIKYLSPFLELMSFVVDYMYKLLP